MTYVKMAHSPVLLISGEITSSLKDNLIHKIIYQSFKATY